MSGAGGAGGAGAGDDLFEDDLELVREDGVRLRARHWIPGWADAERGQGAGVVVLAEGGALTDLVRERVARPLARAGFFVVAHALTVDVADLAVAIDELEAALLGVKALARGRLGVVALGGAATVALAAAAELPQLDALVHAGGGVPAHARLRRTRAAIEVHRAARGRALSTDDVQALVARLRPSHAPLNVRDHDADDGFFTGDTVDARAARDQARQFLQLVLT